MQTYSSNLDAIKAIKRLTGLVIRVTPYDLVQGVTVKSETEIVVTVKVHEIEERRTTVILKNQGTRLIQFTRTESGGWRQSGLFTLWETDFEPVHHSLFGPGKTVAEWLAARQFESMCGRPGTDNHPLDSYRRTVVDGADYTTRRMARHWA